ncbi:MAG TPA: DUF6209 family protein [Kofleriaceae bacterium]|jgi:hypothetical protein
MRFASFALIAMLAACAESGDGTDGTTEAAGAPLIGVDGSTDQADRSCNVVLRSLARESSGLSYVTAGSSWIWGGDIEISTAAAGEGLVPSVMFRMAPSGAWTKVTATATAVAPTPGFARFTFAISAGLPGPGWSGTSLSNAKIEVVPFIAMSEGGRLFDHNRNASDFANYTLTNPDLAIGNDATVCAAAAGPTNAQLVFDASFHQHRDGVLAPGGQVTIVYDTARLTTCRNSQAGHPLWDITAHVEFSPGGQRRDASVRDSSPTIAVPSDARGVTVWFENTAIPGCQAWDSNNGANYYFAALAAPQWIGNTKSLITRDASDPCDGGSSANGGFAFDDWARQRAAVSNLCFEVYQPGLTDHDDPSLWQQLDAQLHYRFVGATTSAWQTSPVNLDRRTGNNARYAINWRGIDPLRSYHCPDVAPTLSQQPDGARASINVEYYVSVNGSEVRPEPGAAFSGTFSDFAANGWRDGNCAPSN